MQQYGKYVIVIGGLLIIAGVILYLFGDKLSFLGRLPGDIRMEKENIRIYIPITTMILLSIVLSLIMYVIRKFL